MFLNSSLEIFKIEYGCTQNILNNTLMMMVMKSMKTYTMNLKQLKKYLEVVNVMDYFFIVLVKIWGYVNLRLKLIQCHCFQII